MSDYFNIAPIPFNDFMTSVNGVVSQFPTLANGALLADSVTTTGRAAMNFCCANNMVSRACFGASCICGTVGAASSGTAIASSFLGIPAAGVVGTLGARGFNRLGKYALRLGNFTNGNFTNVTEIAELMN